MLQTTSPLLFNSFTNFAVQLAGKGLAAASFHRTEMGIQLPVLAEGQIFHIFSVSFSFFI